MNYTHSLRKTLNICVQQSMWTFTIINSFEGEIEKERDVSVRDEHLWQ